VRLSSNQSQATPELLVTFLWRAKEETRYIVVFPFARPNPTPSSNDASAGTDLWYKSYLLRSDSRFEYRLSVNASMEPFAADNPADEVDGLPHFNRDP